MKGRPNKPIIQIDLTGKVVKRFLSTYHAEEELDIDRTSILKVLKGRRKTTFGYKWAYENITSL